MGTLGHRCELNHMRFLSLYVVLLIILVSFCSIFELEPVASGVTFKVRSDGSIIYVGGTGPENYTSIREAINQAQPGETIFVYDGNYYEHLVIDKEINLVGENNENTLISSGEESIVQVTARNVTINNFKVAGRAEYNYKDFNAGIRVTYTDNCTIMNCNIETRFSVGFYLDISTNITLKNNEIMYKGIYILGNEIQYWNTHNIDSTNTLKGKPILYWKNKAGVKVPENMGQIILTNCDDTQLENLEISGANVGVTVGFSKNTNITNCNFIENYHGILLEHSTNTVISTNNFDSNENLAILLSDSINNIIDNNTISNNIDGILLRDYSDDNIVSNNTIMNNYKAISVLYSSNNIIKYNNCSKNIRYGIHLDYSYNNNIIGNILMENKDWCVYFYHSMYNKITNNKIESNSKYGIYLFGESSYNNVTYNNIQSNLDHGIHIYPGSPNNYIIRNIISNNKEAGISASSENHNISGNTLSNNRWGVYGKRVRNSLIINNNISDNHYGIYLTNSTNNRIFHNNIIDNENQAFDDGNSSFWNDTYPSGGNYWSDYDGKDSYGGKAQENFGGDGIGDSSYYIDSDSIDHLPLMEPSTSGKETTPESGDLLILRIAIAIIIAVLLLLIIISRLKSKKKRKKSKKKLK